MIVPPTVANRGFIADRGQTKAEPNQAAAFAVLIVGAGIVAAIAAATASGPFAGLRPVTHATSHLVRTVIPVAPIDASTVFPPPAPPATVQKVVTVYDVPAPAAARPATTSKQSRGDAAEASRGSGSDHHPQTEPSQSPSPDRHGGGGTPPPPIDN